MQTTTYAIGSLDLYLDRVCEQIQLTETQFNTAVNRYEAVGDWLTRTETTLEKLNPFVTPQGSMLQRTTVRPMRMYKEVVPFDLDTVCRADVNPYSFSSQRLYGIVRSRLESHATYAELIRKAAEEFPASGKVIRLAYLADDFYLDVVPTCRDPEDSAGLRLYMCNPSRWHDYTSPLQTWKRTDPFRFANWFNDRCWIAKPLMEKRAASTVVPVPPREPAEVKAPLRRAVQLLKRERDVVFLKDTCRPTSILLTTLAGNHYKGESSLADALENILAGISNEMRNARGARIRVDNPADLIARHSDGVEDLAAPLTAEAYAKFVTMIDASLQAIRNARRAQGVHRLAPLLSERYGEGIVKRAFNSVDQEIEAKNARGELGTKVGSTTLAALGTAIGSGAVQAMPKHNLHGDDEWPDAR